MRLKMAWTLCSALLVICIRGSDANQTQCNGVLCEKALLPELDMEFALPKAGLLAR